MPQRTSILEFKRVLRDTFYALQDVACSSRDLRLWMLDERMMPDEFIDTYNTSIWDNELHCFDFPGRLVPERYLVSKGRHISSARTNLHLDELLFHEASEKNA